MANQGFRIYTCECGEIVVQTGDALDQEALHALHTQKIELVSGDAHSHECVGCGDDLTLAELPKREFKALPQAGVKDLRKWLMRK